MSEHNGHQPQPEVEIPTIHGLLAHADGPLRYTVVRGINIDVVRLEDGMGLLITHRSTNEIEVLPMPTEVAQTIGKALMAPRIVVPAQNGHAH